MLAAKKDTSPPAPQPPGVMVTWMCSRVGRARTAVGWGDVQSLIAQRSSTWLAPQPPALPHEAG